MTEYWKEKTKKAHYRQFKGKRYYFPKRKKGEKFFDYLARTKEVK